MTDDLFRHRLMHMIDQRHPMVRLTQLIEWKDIEQRLSGLYNKVTEHEKVEGVNKGGRPRIPLRRLVVLLYCKYYYDLSDEAVVGYYQRTTKRTSSSLYGTIMATPCPT